MLHASQRRVPRIVAWGIALFSVGVLSSVLVRRAGRGPAAQDRVTPDTLLNALNMDAASVAPIGASGFEPLDHDARDTIEERLSSEILLSMDRMAIGSWTPNERESFSVAAASVLTPYLLGDYPRYRQAIESLGGRFDDGADAQQRAQEHWRTYYHRVRITDYAPARVDAAALRMNGDRRSVSDDFRFMAGLGMTHRPHIKTTGLSGVTKGRTGESEEAVEARVPVQIRMASQSSLAPAVIGVVLGRDPSTGQWIPSSVRLYINSAPGSEPSTVEEMRGAMDRRPGNLPS